MSRLRPLLQYSALVSLFLNRRQPSIFSLHSCIPATSRCSREIDAQRCRGGKNISLVHSVRSTSPVRTYSNGGWAQAIVMVYVQAHHPSLSAFKAVARTMLHTTAKAPQLYLYCSGEYVHTILRTTRTGERHSPSELVHACASLGTLGLGGRARSSHAPHTASKPVYYEFLTSAEWLYFQRRH